jgi:hypothetical protein
VIAGVVADQARKGAAESPVACNEPQPTRSVRLTPSGVVAGT